MAAPRPHRLSPAQVLVVSLLALIAAGTVLLRLPISSQGQPISVLDALFTSASAVCVTGLIVVDTPTQFSVFGQTVLLVLIQAGGLGYMTISSVVAAALGRQLSVHERRTLQEALNVQSMEGLARFTIRLLRFTLAFELAGAVLLAARFAFDMNPAQAAYFGLFHSVSAFNNAGFALFSDNLIGYRGDWIVNLVICGLIVCGGIGFIVLAEIGDFRSRERLSVHTKVVLSMTALLILVGAVAVFLLERTNPRTLGPLGFSERLLASIFQAVTPRTAGFNTLDVGSLTEPTLFLTMILMFIGAAPGGTGGGVKVTTFGIVVTALWATVRGVDEPTLFKRRIPLQVVVRAFFICLIAFLGLNAMAVVLLVHEQHGLIATLFETASAFGTVGLSVGTAGAPYSLAGAFSPTGKALVAAAMFIGRIGPLTLAVALARRRTQTRIRYAEATILVG
ncbi:MAG: TrkH family potassium uptake protein [Vicinamibacterales bacterium]